MTSVSHSLISEGRPVHLQRYSELPGSCARDCSARATSSPATVGISNGRDWRQQFSSLVCTCCVASSFQITVDHRHQVWREPKRTRQATHQIKKSLLNRIHLRIL